MYQEFLTENPTSENYTCTIPIIYTYIERIFILRNIFYHYVSTDIKKILIYINNMNQIIHRFHNNLCFHLNTTVPSDNSVSVPYSFDLICLAFTLEFRIIFFVTNHSSKNTQQKITKVINVFFLLFIIGFLPQFKQNN